MRSSTALLAGAFTLALAVGAEARGPGFAGPHVRALDPAAAALMAEGQQKSATVRDLFKKLDGTDIVAYIRIAPPSAGTPKAAFTFVSNSKVVRFVMASISGDLPADRRIELLAHELQHAVDVARLPWVTDNVQFQNYLSHTGWRDATTAAGYETATASRAERQARKEVRGVSLP